MTRKNQIKQKYLVLGGKLWKRFGRGLISESGGTVMMEYLLVCAMLILVGTFVEGKDSVGLWKMAGVSVDAKDDFGVVGTALVTNARRLMWMVAQPFP